MLAAVDVQDLATDVKLHFPRAAERILVEARETLRAAGATRRAADRARDGETGLLRLGFVASAAFLRLPELLRALRRSVPDAEVELLRLSSEDQLRALAEERIDAGLARVPQWVTFASRWGGMIAYPASPEAMPRSGISDSHPQPDLDTLTPSARSDAARSARRKREDAHV